MCKVQFLLVLLVLTIIGSSYAKYPTNWPRCSVGNTACLPDVINYYIERNAGGNPELNLIPIDPLFVPAIDIIQGNDSPVNIKLNLKDCNFLGFSTLHVSSVSGFEKDPRKSKFELVGRIPQLSIIGDYKASGTVIILPVVGNGPANLTFDNLDIVVRLNSRIDTRKDREYLQFNSVDVDFNTTRLHMNFENLFNGDKVLGDTTNKFVNENWSDILNELKAVLRDAIGGIVKSIISPVFAKFPYDELWSKEE